MLSKIYIELGTRVQNASLWDVVRFPLESSLPSNVQWSAKWWDHGASHSKKSGSREKLLTAVKDKGINELQLTGKIGESSESTSDRIVGGWFWFNPSPMSQLWADVPKYDLKSIANDRARRSFGGVESVRKLGFRLPYPSVLECTIDFSTRAANLTEDELQRVGIDLILAAMPRELSRQELFGYGCLRGHCRKQMMLHGLSPWPGAVDELGAKFEAIYPILVGTKAACEDFALATRGLSSVVPLPDTSPTAMVVTPPSRMAELLQMEGPKAYLVTRDVSTHYETGYIRYSSPSHLTRE